MTLGALFDALESVGPALGADPAITGSIDAWRSRPVTAMAYDSRQVGPGALFVAMRGQRTDGARFVSDAVARGAVAVLADVEAPVGVTVPWIVVPDARRALALAAAAFHRHPSRELTVIGVTGTNGKTTTATLVQAVCQAAGWRCGLIGTIAYDLGDEVIDAGRTTPESADLQAYLRRMVEAGCRAVAMEVSSHALALRRADEIRFAAAVFTNLTRDHLDFHGDMESYFAAKRRLFEELSGDAAAVVNADDPRGPGLARIVPRAVTYGLDHPADVGPAEPVRYTLRGLRFSAMTPAGPVQVNSALVGRPFASNVLAAVATGIAIGLPPAAIERGIASVSGVAGRFEVVSGAADDLTVVVDYAHTDDALRNLLETARPLAPKRLITVFGCGGDRDRTKRPLMGAVAARLSDLVVVTSDNPRGEDPLAIIEDIKRGLGTSPYLAIADRRTAIEEAVRLAEPGDTVLLAGKGHERYQVIGTGVVPFDDREAARAALARRRGERVPNGAAPRKAG